MIRTKTVNSTDPRSAFSQAEFSFELPEEVLDKIMRVLSPVVLDKFIPLRQKVAIAKAEAEDRLRRAQEQQRLLQLEEKRQEVLKIVDSAKEHLDQCEEVLRAADALARPLAKDIEMSSDETQAAAAEAEAKAEQAGESLATARAKVQEAEREIDANAELRIIGKREVPWLQKRLDEAKEWQASVITSASSGKERALRKAYAENERNQAAIVTGLRGKMSVEGKTGEQFFEELTAEQPLAKAAFVALSQGLEDARLSEVQAERVFAHIAGEGESISKERFLEIIRLFYKCVKSTVLAEDICIKSKTVRRIQEGEVLEALEGPTKEGVAGVQRVRCQAVQDSAIGWATIAGNQGTFFLLPGGNLFACTQDTPITDGLSLPAKSLRDLTKGELLEVLEFPRKDGSADVQRVRGKAKLDGTIGWVTLSNQGTTYLEPQ